MVLRLHSNLNRIILDLSREILPLRWLLETPFGRSGRCDALNIRSAMEIILARPPYASWKPFNGFLPRNIDGGLVIGLRFTDSLSCSDLITVEIKLRQVRNACRAIPLYAWLQSPIPAGYRFRRCAPTERAVQRTIRSATSAEATTRIITRRLVMGPVNCLARTDYLPDRTGPGARRRLHDLLALVLLPPLPPSLLQGKSA